MDTLFSKFQSGMNFGFLAGRGYYSSQEARSQVDAMAATGLRWVCLNVAVFQDHFASLYIYQDIRMSPADHEVVQIIEYIHEKGMSVFLRPVLELQDGTWRGRIRFPEENLHIIPGRSQNSWTQWFDSLRPCLCHYAKIAQETGVELFSVGCEMDGTLFQDEQYRRTIRAVREVYTGMVTYSANWSPVEAARPWVQNGLTSGEDWIRPTYEPWFKELDCLCTAYYTSAADGPGASVEDMQGKMELDREVYRAMHQRLGMPIIIAETGCRSVCGGAVLPWEHQKEGAYDPQEQVNYMKALFRTYKDEPWCGGIFWWKWQALVDRPGNACDPAGDTGFSLLGKPGLEAFRTIIAQHL
jgi:hypothetical protein